MKINTENLNINLRHMRALQAIAQTGSFSGAAVQLGIVPSALSELIRHLEAAIGAPLFDRSTRPPLMTPLAREFLEDTAPLLNGMDHAVTRLRQSAGVERGSLFIGASPSAISEVIAPVLKQFLLGRPKLQCLLHDDIAERLAEMVSDGRLDLAIAGRARHSPDLRQREIIRDPVGLVCAADHPLGRRETITLIDIDADSLIGLDPQSGTYQLLAQSELPDAFRRPRLQAYSTVAQLCMLRQGLGVALLPKNAATLFRDPSIVFVPITDLALWRTLYLVEPARRPKSDVAKSFIASLVTGRELQK